MVSTSYNSNTPSSSGSTTPLIRWDVFLSFSGNDTRYTFTDYLYDSLQRNGIRTFRDDPELRRGEVISDALFQAIQQSKTYVVVFSQNYAYSKWCLDELVQILGCQKSIGRLVLPIFYNIEPSDVRNQTGGYNQAFQNHEFHFDMDRSDRWRATLTNVGNLAGYHVHKNMSAVDIINKVVDRVLVEINPMTLNVAKYPVGLASRVNNITKLLSPETEGINMIGIHGMGGVGKTTLAKAVYNQNYSGFQGSCFLSNVSEVSVTERGLLCLQQKLINDVLKCKNIHVDNVDHGIELIRDRLCSFKILLVIDDLDNPTSLEFLVGQFASGSRIIITTRNEDLLDTISVKARYKVNELDDADSRQLFYQHAFGDDQISGTYIQLSEEVLERAGGLPLALKVFGSNLLNQSEEGWRWFIHKVKRVSIDDVDKKLKISFDALKMVDPMLQDIFLDIACFFIGQKKEWVAKILETCYSFVNHNIDILRKRCLLTINNREELEIHDLLRDMGREIARNNFAYEPEKHSRLWVSNDICELFRKNKGTKAIEGICHHYLDYEDGSKEVSYTAETFKKMSNLRFLHLDRVKITGSFDQTLENLRWLCWDRCPLYCLPYEFYPHKLVILELPCSKLRTVWELNMIPQMLNNLKILNMSYSLELTTTPDFTMLPCLETLNLEGCKSLQEVHISIGSLARLVSLSLGFCRNLMSLPDSISNVRGMKILNISNCSSLLSLPPELGNIEFLEELNAEGLAIRKLPESVGCLSKLVELKLRYNMNLETLPDPICKLEALEVLSIADCSSLKALPIYLGNLKSLKQLNAEGLTVRELPDSIGHLTKLVELRLSYNKNLETLPDSICNLRVLEVLSIDYCSRLESLPVELGNITSLKELNAWGLIVSNLPDSVRRNKLVKLRVSDKTSRHHLQLGYQFWGSELCHRVKKRKEKELHERKMDGTSLMISDGPEKKNPIKELEDTSLHTSQRLPKTTPRGKIQWKNIFGCFWNRSDSEGIIHHYFDYQDGSKEV